ncbi:hypothetical protein DER45DRAFT_85998 [Fusarium avenaceum]|nr:hypothetical protein DER45DRAFT_85998 [Fusarium avenaceum]
MGGKAFAHVTPPLLTPRMSKEVYLAAKNQVVRALSKGFDWIDSPTEGPGKEDYGDIDIIVTQLKDPRPSKEELLGHINYLLGSEYQINSKGDEISGNFAIPWPADFPYPPGYGEDKPDDDTYPHVAPSSVAGPSTPKTAPKSHLESSPNDDFESSPKTPFPSPKQPSPRTLEARAKAFFESGIWTRHIRVSSVITPPKRQSSQGSAPTTPDGGEKRRFSWIPRSKAPFIPRDCSYNTLTKALENADEALKKKNQSSPSTPDKPSNVPIKRKQRLYIQVDVTYCFDVRQAKYMRFFQSHGDIWQILGSTIRPMGLTVDNVGLWIRVPEIERVNKNQAKVWLTSKPTFILKFIGVSIPQYYRPFQSIEAMFEYVAKSPMFSVPPKDDKEDKDVDLATMTHNDRKRMSARPVYRKWVTEFKPRCREQGLYSESVYTRETVKEKAFREFTIETEYHERLRKYIYQEQKKAIRKQIKAALPIGDGDGDPDQQALSRRGLTIKAMSEILIDEVDETIYGIVAPRALLEPNGTYNMDRVSAFINDKLEDVSAAALKREEKMSKRREAHKEIKARLVEQARMKREKEAKEQRDEAEKQKRDLEAKIQLEAETYPDFD